MTDNLALVETVLRNFQNESIPVLLEVNYITGMSIELEIVPDFMLFCSFRLLEIQFFDVELKTRAKYKTLRRKKVKFSLKIGKNAKYAYKVLMAMWFEPGPSSSGSEILGLTTPLNKQGWAYFSSQNSSEKSNTELAGQLQSYITTYNNSIKFLVTGIAYLESSSGK